VGERRIAETIRHQNGPFVKLCQDYGFNFFDIPVQVELIEDEEGNVLEDIRTFSDNENMARKIMDVVFQLTRDPDTRIFASIAGGRKTMSAYLALAMQLFARDQDHLTHVLVWPPEVEADRGFFYPEPQKEVVQLQDGKTVAAGDIRIDLADIPIIRLRHVIEAELGQDVADYLELIKLSQFRINELIHSLVCEWDIAAGELRIALGENRYTATLSGKCAAIYHYACIHPKGFELPKCEKMPGMEVLYEKYYKIRDFSSSRKEGILWDSSQIQKDISYLNKQLHQQLPVTIYDRVKIVSLRSREKTLYRIPSCPKIIEPSPKT
jgi:CRISPR-associated protein (TIGR02584 family)